MGRTKILLRDVDGLARIRFVVNATANTLYVTDNQGLKELEDNGETSRIVGFPASDAFKLNSQNNIKEGEKIDWSQENKYS